jgi:predicted metal-dependent hydrolase
VNFRFFAYSQIPIDIHRRIIIRSRDTMLICEASPPGQILLAIRQFNTREWYDCHETIEELWLGETGEMRNFLQGVLQVAVALHHWRNGNHGGAVSLLASGANYLKRVSDVCLWVDVAALIVDADRARRALEDLGKERMEALEASCIPLIRMKDVTGNESA